jgi:hypothetical protein
LKISKPKWLKIAMMRGRYYEYEYLTNIVIARCIAIRAIQKIQSGLHVFSIEERVMTY